MSYYMRCPNCGQESSTGHICARFSVNTEPTLHGPPFGAEPASDTLQQLLVAQQRIAALEKRLAITLAALQAAIDAAEERW